jgi:hypothetical protein
MLYHRFVTKQDVLVRLAIHVILILQPHLNLHPLQLLIAAHVLNIIVVIQMILFLAQVGILLYIIYALKLVVQTEDASNVYLIQQLLRCLHVVVQEKLAAATAVPRVAAVGLDKHPKGLIVRA